MNNSEKIILDLCGGTGSWSRPYKEAGYDVRLVTLPDNDVRTYTAPENVYGILAAPPCTMFSFARTHGKSDPDIEGALEIVSACLRIIWNQQLKIKTGQKKTSLKFWALENPNRGLLRHYLGKPAYIFHPYEFGDLYKKETALWGYFNEPIKTTNKKPELKKFDALYSNEIHPKLIGQYNRTERRAVTPEGFAKAFFNANP